MRAVGAASYTGPPYPEEDSSLAARLALAEGHFACNRIVLWKNSHNALHGMTLWLMQHSMSQYVGSPKAFRCALAFGENGQGITPTENKCKIMNCLGCRIWGLAPTCSRFGRFLFQTGRRISQMSCNIGRSGNNLSRMGHTLDLICMCNKLHMSRLQMLEEWRGTRPPHPRGQFAVRGRMCKYSVAHFMKSKSGVRAVDEKTEFKNGNS